MLKKMRIRVITAAMLAFAAVMFLIALLVNWVNYAAVTGRADQTLSYILRYESNTPSKPGPDAPPPRPFMELPDIEANYMTRFFVVRLDPDNNLTSTHIDYIASIDEEDALDYAARAAKKGKDRGYIGDYRYCRKALDDSTVFIFLNVSRELLSVRTLLDLTLAVVGISLILVFIFVFFLSRRALRPIIHNIESQKQFITDASHELKTPLTSIATSTDVIAMEKGEDEWTENIRSQTERMGKLVNELVILSRLDEEKPIPVRESFSLSDTAWEIAEAFRSQAKVQNKRFDIDIQDDLTLLGDRDAIRQMLSVLLDNAIRYSDPEGEIRFCISKKRSRISIEVFNTCNYDTPPDTDRLFDRFYRPDTSRNKSTGGTGVGLAIAKAVAQTHGGKISANCPSGKTMTIKVVF
ncbi:MAG: HAMP domain-containing histidine kinase [Lachnospiraceae bacterium]|nr:HAMP domain-containing histidine kinase [Lachnospiraceae bacterium]